jgi:nicotinamidase-related amidase
MPEALVIVDFQNDFTPGGALAVPHGDEIAEKLNELAASDRFDLVVATRDWHPPEHSSFAAQGGPWPPHCVASTEGAELHLGLDAALVDIVVDKGTGPRRSMPCRPASRSRSTVEPHVGSIPTAVPAPWKSSARPEPTS